MPSIVWPRTLIPFEVMFHPEVRSRSGGVSVNGYEQVVVSSAGRWRARMTFNLGQGHQSQRALGRRADSVLAWRAMLAKLEGRSEGLLIGPYDGINSPATIAGTGYGGETLHSDDASFDDDTPYVQRQTPALIAATAGLGATTVSVDMLAGHSPEPGQYFSVGERLYLIKTATEGVSDVWALTVWPPVRAQMAAGDEADFDDPVCAMRFRSDDGGEAMFDRPLQFGSGALDLVEALPET